MGHFKPLADDTAVVDSFKRMLLADKALAHAEHKEDPDWWYGNLYLVTKVSYRVNPDTHDFESIVTDTMMYGAEFMSQLPEHQLNDAMKGWYKAVIDRFDEEASS